MIIKIAVGESGSKTINQFIEASLEVQKSISASSAMGFFLHDWSSAALKRSPCYWKFMSVLQKSHRFSFHLMDYIHTQELTEKKPSGPKSFWTEVTEVKCLVDGLFSAFFLHSAFIFTNCLNLWEAKVRFVLPSQGHFRLYNTFRSNLFCFSLWLRRLVHVIVANVYMYLFWIFVLICSVFPLIIFHLQVAYDLTIFCFPAVYLLNQIVSLLLNNCQPQFPWLRSIWQIMSTFHWLM